MDKSVQNLGWKLNGQSKRGKLKKQNYIGDYIPGVARLEVNESHIPIFEFVKETHQYVIRSASPRAAFKM